MSDDRPLIIANIKYKSPQRTGRGTGVQGLKSTLKYLQFRDNANIHLAQKGRERWVDHGMGGSYGEILDNALHLRSEKVLAWTWVISPEPDVMALIPESERNQFLRNLTEAVVDRYYDERGFEPEYSYVVHHAMTKDGRAHTHSHVILPGTAIRHMGGREDMVNFKNRGHLELLDDIANQELRLLMSEELLVEYEKIVTDLDMEQDYMSEIS